ncbi:MAG: enoyl-CoA hydratase-related protein [Pseudomonadales bacterium]
MEYKAIRYTASDGIAIVTLSRPHRMNAWTGRMHAEYRHAMAAADADNNVRAIVVTGEGRGFCVGADSQALTGHVEKGGYDPGTPEKMANPGYGVRDEYDVNFAWHFGLTKPVVCAINGPAAGVGLVLACFADIRFAAAGVKLTTAHGKLNLPAEFGLSWLLPRMIGLPRANDLLLTSRIFMSEEAAEMGLVNAVVPAGQLMTQTLAYVRSMIDTVSPGSLRETRRQIYADLHRDIGASVDESERLVREMMTQPDYAEGVKAFLDKRPPEWGKHS